MNLETKKIFEISITTNVETLKRENQNFNILVNVNEVFIMSRNSCVYGHHVYHFTAQLSVIKPVDNGVLNG